MGENIFGTCKAEFKVGIKNDNLSLVKSINAIGAITQERRLIATLESLREMIKNEEVNNVGFIPGAANLAGGLTKCATGYDLRISLNENIRLTISGKEKQKKMWKTAADKQDLFMYLVNFNNYFIVFIYCYL